MAQQAKCLPQKHEDQSLEHHTYGEAGWAWWFSCNPRMQEAERVHLQRKLASQTSQIGMFWVQVGQCLNNTRWEAVKEDIQRHPPISTLLHAHIYVHTHVQKRKSLIIIKLATDIEPAMELGMQKERGLKCKERNNFLHTRGKGVCNDLAEDKGKEGGATLPSIKK